MDDGEPEVPLERYRVLVEGVVLGGAGLEDLEAVRGVLGATCRSITLGSAFGDPAWNRLVRQSQRPRWRRRARLQRVLKVVAESRDRQAARHETQWSAELAVEAADVEMAMDFGELSTMAAFAAACDLDVVVHRTEVQFGWRSSGHGHVRVRLASGRPFRI